ncbi:MAG: hypothetical protein J5I47_04945 [Vicingus serpentipes]|nr:hypothetical protein [Vicingus serpentipes]
MKKLLTLIIGFFIATFLVAQDNNDFFQDTTQRVNIDLGVGYTYGSGTISNEFLNKFVFGGRIEQDLKDKAYKKLANNNFAGGDLKYQVNVEIPMDTFFRRTNLSLLIGLEHVAHFDANFTEDLFKFTFEGNKQFAGKTAEIGGTNFNAFTYQQINFGIISHKIKNQKLAKEGFIVSLIKGQSHQAITIPRGNIFTEQLGKELEVDINYEYNASDTANKGVMAFNGYGVSTDLFTEFFLKNGNKIHLAVNDLGFIVFNNHSIDQSADSTFFFEGVEVDNIFDLNDSLLAEISKDSIINDITNHKKESYSIALPTSFNINYTKYISQKWKMDIGFYYKVLSNYFPLIYTNTYYYFNTSLALKFHLSYGGYGKLNTGIAIAKSVKNQLNIFIGTNNLGAFIVLGASYANSGFVGIKAYF